MDVTAPEPEAAGLPEPEADLPDIVLITVTLANSRKVGARSCAPGEVVTLDAETARYLIREGQATRA